MFPAPFDYLDPTTIDEALDALRRHGADAKLLAGGQSFVAAMNLGLARPAVVVDLNRVQQLATVTRENGTLVLGSMVRQHVIETDSTIRDFCPLLTEAVAYVGNPRVRRRGTVGGSLCHADPASELPAVMLALEATLEIASAGRSRSAPAESFFIGPLATTLGDDELLTSVRVPTLPTGAGWAFEEAARRAGDFALVGVAAVIVVDDGRCADARLAFCGAGPTPTRARNAEERLRQSDNPRASIDEAAVLAASELAVDGDALASAAYRRHLARVLSARTLERAFERATTGERG